ncbi:MAG: MnmC family methyltransferase [Cyanobacteriota bacterium]|nr:MnmC family methyltransferase [Cyanobacteriota bacterium]
MTWPGCGAELSPRLTRDGSFSLYSHRFGEAFHSAAGALREARETFVGPAQLARFAPGSTVVVLDVCVGTGSNTAALLEACAARGLRLQWHGLELDPAPLQLATADGGFCAQWHPAGLEPLRQLAASGTWSSAQGAGVIHWGDARQQVAALQSELTGQVDLVLHDAFSPRHCPELWTLEFLGFLARLLGPAGRLLTYCSAAAVRAALLQLGLELAAMPTPDPAEAGARWSGGTVASWQVLVAEAGAVQVEGLRPLSPMELEHLATNAAVPYRDPTGQAVRTEILAAREVQQRAAAASGALEPTSAWRRRWRLGR